MRQYITANVNLVMPQTMYRNYVVSSGCVGIYLVSIQISMIQLHCSEPWFITLPSGVAKNFKKVNFNISKMPEWFLLSLQTGLIVDASAIGLAAMLTQKRPDGTFNVVGYASRTLSKTEHNYCQTEREALAII